MNSWGKWFLILSKGSLWKTYINLGLYTFLWKDFIILFWILQVLSYLQMFESLKKVLKSFRVHDIGHDQISPSVFDLEPHFLGTYLIRKWYEQYTFAEWVN